MSADAGKTANLLLKDCFCIATGTEKGDLTGTDILVRDRPRRASASICSVQVATTQAALRATIFSSLARAAGPAVISSPPKVCTTGTRCGRAANWAATPVVQEWA